MAWLRRADPLAGVSSEVRAALAAIEGPRDKPLSAAVDEQGTTVVAATNHLYAVSPTGAIDLHKPWHLVDAGTWDHDDYQLRVTWVDGHPTSRWILREPGVVPETLRERVQATVVLADTVRIDNRRVSRVVIRRELASGELLGQILLARGASGSDPLVTQASRQALAALKEQVGLA